VPWGRVQQRERDDVCSGTITDELHITGDRWTLNLTLYEIGTTLGYTPTQAIVYLTNVVSPTDSHQEARLDGRER
jgi:hypothetical protein